MADERAAAVGVVVREADPSEDRLDRLVVEVLVLGREDVDRRGDDEGAIAVDPLPREVGSREDVGVGLLDVGPEEVPRGVRVRVRLIEPDVAAPDDHRARRPQRVDHAGGLRVVEEDDVAVGDELCELRGRRSQRLLVELALADAELAAVAGDAVQQVVDPLRELEEGGFAADHTPAAVEADPADVGEQRLQELGDATAARGRVDVPDRAVPEEHATVLHAALDLPEALAENSPESLRVHAPDVNFLQAVHRGEVIRGP